MVYSHNSNQLWDQSTRTEVTTNTAISQSSHPQPPQEQQQQKKMSVKTTPEEGSSISSSKSAKTGATRSVRSGSSSSLSSNNNCRMAIKKFQKRAIAIVLALCFAALCITYSVFKYMRHDELQEFERQFDIYSHEVLESFRNSVELKLNAIDTMATSITTAAMDTNQTFPFVTVSNFAQRGANIRVSSDALIIHWLPLVSDENRLEWEEYAFQNRFQIDDAFQQDKILRTYQDEQFGLLQDDDEGDADRRRGLQQKKNDDAEEDEEVDPNVYPYDDSGYHMKIFNIATGQVYPNGTGPYLPIWQRSPVNGGKQWTINVDFGKALHLKGVLDAMIGSGSGDGGEESDNQVLAQQHQPKVVLNRVVILDQSSGTVNFNKNLLIGQYRHNAEQYQYDPLSFLAYPVFDSLDPKTKKLAGVVASNIYWRLYFDNILPPGARGVLCVMENSFNQTFAYQVNGHESVFLGAGDPHEAKYDEYMVSENVNEYVRSRAGPETRAYTTVPLHDTYGQYTIRIYPTGSFEGDYVTDKPFLYAVAIGVTFLIASLVFTSMLSRALVQHANATTEKNLTAYFAHELRNPLSAIDSALHAMPDENDPEGERLPESAKELVDGMLLCTSFMASLMNNLLDARQLEEGKMTLYNKPLSLSSLVEGVHKMMAPAVKPGVEFTHKCQTRFSGQQNDWVIGDRHRLEQVLTNVVTNAIKYTSSGCITLSVAWNDEYGNNGSKSSKRSSFFQYQDHARQGWVHFTIQDTGPGISKADQDQIFERFVKRGGAPGSGLGLAIAKWLVELMGGTIHFESDPAVKPGTTCIVCIPLQVCEAKESQHDERTEFYSPAYEFALSSPTPTKAPQATTTIAQAASSSSSSTQVLHAPPALPPSPFLTGDDGRTNGVVDESSNGIAALNASGSTVPLFALCSASPQLQSPATEAIVKAKRDQQQQQSVAIITTTMPITEEISILLVDDIKMNRMMLKRRLQKGIAVNCKITEASTGEEALKILSRHESDGDKIHSNSAAGCDVSSLTTTTPATTPLDHHHLNHFDVIVMDQYMGDAGGAILGTDAVRTMRRMEVMSMIVGCSGNDMGGEFIEAGADAFWGKPLPSNGEMIDLLRSHLRQ